MNCLYASVCNICSIAVFTGNLIYGFSKIINIIKIPVGDRLFQFSIQFLTKFIQDFTVIISQNLMK